MIRFYLEPNTDIDGEHTLLEGWPHFDKPHVNVVRKVQTDWLRQVNPVCKMGGTQKPDPHQGTQMYKTRIADVSC